MTSRKGRHHHHFLSNVTLNISHGCAIGAPCFTLDICLINQNKNKIKVMKKFFLSALIAVSIISTAFAGDVKKVNHVIAKNFAAEFGDVKNVEWTTSSNYSTATFTLNNKRTNAFYNQDGTFIGTSQAISIDDLPAYAKRRFAKKYADHTVVEAIEFVTDNDTAYFLSAVKDNKTVVIKIAEGSITKM
jgi:hypothetical protein